MSTSRPGTSAARSWTSCLPRPKDADSWAGASIEGECGDLISLYTCETDAIQKRGGLRRTTSCNISANSPFVPSHRRTNIPLSNLPRISNRQVFNHHAFGGDGPGIGIDLLEPRQSLSQCEAPGIRLVSTTTGRPDYAPHIQRLALYPPSERKTGLQNI